MSTHETPPIIRFVGKDKSMKPTDRGRVEIAAMHPLPLLTKLHREGWHDVTARRRGDGADEVVGRITPIGEGRRVEVYA